MSDMDLPLSTFNPNVQVYAVANPSLGDYQLIGPAFLSILTDQVQGQTVHYLQAKNKQGQTLMLSLLRSQNNYEKQKGSVIAWRDSQQRVHSQLALSFSEENQCDFIWRIICQKIGKNYLQISGREALQMPREDNLTYILEKTKNSKDMVEYHILNSQDFAVQLSRTFAHFQLAQDLSGLSLVGKIVKSILVNLDHRLVEKLFADPFYKLLLEVQRFQTSVDFWSLWEGKLRIRRMVVLSDVLNNKIQLIHRLSFYRENILNLVEQTYLEHILMMTQTQCYKDVIMQLTRGETLQKLLQMTVLPSPPQLSKRDNAQDETFPTETQQLKKRALFEGKTQFLMQALLMIKQVQSQNIKVRLIDRMYQADVIKFLGQSFDQNFLRSVDFLGCLAQASASKFFQHLRQHYRRSPSDNLLMKLAKKYCLGTQEFQWGILEVLKSLGQPLKSKQNLGFLTGTFLAYVFQCCRDQRALLALLHQALGFVQNPDGLFQVCLKQKLFHKLTVFLRNSGRDKQSQLRSCKLLKRILVQNAITMRNRQIVQPKQTQLLTNLNQQVMQSGFFQYCLQILSKYIQCNNVICSSMLQNLKIIADFKKYSAYQQYIQNNRNQLGHLQKYISKILQAQPNMGNRRRQIPSSHRLNLQQEMQEQYLMEPEQQYQPPQIQKNIKEKQVLQIIPMGQQELASQMAALKELTQQLERRQKEKEEGQSQNEDKGRKRVKQNEQTIGAITIELDLDFDQQQGNL